MSQFIHIFEANVDATFFLKIKEDCLASGDPLPAILVWVFTLNYCCCKSLIRYASVSKARISSNSSWVSTFGVPAALARR